MRLVGEDGEQIGIKSTDEAREYAYGRNLDLVEVAAQADPPVARVMDYSKYRYEQEQRAKQARKHQLQIQIKEIKLRPKIGIHDYETKKGHVVRFLNGRAKVKVTIMFRGRETTHPERGRDLLMRLAEDVKEIGAVEQPPLLDGRIGLRGDLDQIEVLAPRVLTRFVRVLDTDLRAIVVHQPHLRRADHLVDARLRYRGAIGLHVSAWSQRRVTKLSFPPSLRQEPLQAAARNPRPATRLNLRERSAWEVRARTLLARVTG